MKRFTKTCGSIVLAASLVLSLVGVVPAKAATSDADLTEFATTFAKVKEATAAIAKDKVTVSKSKANVAVSFSGIDVAKVPVELTTTVDPTTHKAKMVGFVEIPDLSSIASFVPDLAKVLEKYDLKAGTKAIEDYGDLEKKCLYRFNSKVDRAEVAALPSTLQGGSILDKIDVTKFAKLTPYLTLKKSATDMSLNLKADEAGIKAAKAEINTILKSVISPDSEYKDLLTKLNKDVDMTGVDLTFKFYVDAATGALAKHDIEGSVNITYNKSFPLAIKFSNSTTSSVSTESVAIPAAFTDGAQLIAGYPVAKGGINFVSTLSGKNTVFSVSSVKNAKTLTIPASITELGTSYKVTSAAKNAFKKATKLKTLTVKNGSLKKTLKKNPSKYGLSKKVKIK